MSLLSDVLIVASASGALFLSAYGIWGDVQGGNIPTKVWFGWHPVLTTLAFPGLMLLGRWSYISDSVPGTDGLSAADGKKQARRPLHRFVMSLAAIVALLGYLAIFMAHLPKGQFLGYDFKTGAFKPWRKLVHIYLGYTVLLAMVAQAVMGFLKLQALDSSGAKSFTFHGQLGKSIIFLGSANIAIAASFWMWSAAYAWSVAAVALLCGSLGAFWPSPSPGFDHTQLATS
eukprot:TRINITY_DN63174_c0_g1_i3.p1 TRINITY_DN63174_c0_g1~~TRINITY_DN63174_c0_g1_i3.p1  ORF type:complete len:230 (+),score=28.30 TRINITY_DN63174_c0_g1_i3:117-806(+)